MIKRITLRLDEELYRSAKYKCKTQFGIGLAPLIKVFLKAFTTQKGISFCVGDEELAKQFSSWLSKKRLEIGREGCAPLPGPRLKDLYNFSPSSWPPSWL